MRLIMSTAAFLLIAGSGANAQVALTSYAGPNGMIDVQKFTCAQLANTFQEDADAMAMWYSGWYNGLAKKHFFNLPRAKENLHQVIVHCKANQNKKVIQAIDFVIKEEKKK